MRAFAIGSSRRVAEANAANTELESKAASDSTLKTVDYLRGIIKYLYFTLLNASQQRMLSGQLAKADLWRFRPSDLPCHQVTVGSADYMNKITRLYKWDASFRFVKETHK